MNENHTIPPAVESEAAPQPVETSPAHRPFSVNLLVLGIIILCVMNLVRFGLALRYWNYLDTLTSVSPWYLALSGLVWGLAGLPLAWGLLRGKAWSPRLMRAMALTYTTYYWLDQIFLQDHPLTGAEGSARLLLPGNWTFMAGLTVLLLAFTVWSLKRRSVRDYFGEANEHQPENETLT